jgi:hypothetical protein
VLRRELAAIRHPEVTDIVRLARLFDVSKDAMARAYADYSRDAVAIIAMHNGRVFRTYRNIRNFPALGVSQGQAVPVGSLAENPLQQGQVSTIEECEPALWVRDPDDRTVSSLTEQVLRQRDGFSLIMLVAEMRDQEELEAPERW